MSCPYRQNMPQWHVPEREKRRHSLFPCGGLTHLRLGAVNESVSGSMFLQPESKETMLSGGITEKTGSEAVLNGVSTQETLVMQARQDPLLSWAQRSGFQFTELGLADLTLGGVGSPPPEDPGDITWFPAELAEGSVPCRLEDRRCPVRRVMEPR